MLYLLVVHDKAPPIPSARIWLRLLDAVVEVGTVARSLVIDGIVVRAQAAA